MDADGQLETGALTRPSKPPCGGRDRLWRRLAAAARLLLVLQAGIQPPKTTRPPARAWVTTRLANMSGSGVEPSTRDIPASSFQRGGLALLAPGSFTGGVPCTPRARLGAIDIVRNVGARRRGSSTTPRHSSLTTHGRGHTTPAAASPSPSASAPRRHALAMHTLYLRHGHRYVAPCGRPPPACSRLTLTLSSPNLCVRR
jgi:hypothetical protein